MSLADTMKALYGRDLTTDEMATLSRFEQQFEIAEDDPLLVVLALMARNHLMVEALPERLKEAAAGTIELHRQTLREQSTVIAKELITDLGTMLAKSVTESQTAKNVRFAIYVAVAAVGFFAGGIAVRFLLH